MPTTSNAIQSTTSTCQRRRSAAAAGSAAGSPAALIWVVAIALPSRLVQREPSGGFDESSVNHVVGSGHVGSPLGRQQHDEGGHLLGRRESSGGESADAGHDPFTGGV